MTQKRKNHGTFSFGDAMGVLARLIAFARMNRPQISAAARAWWHRPHPFFVLPLLTAPALTAFALLGVYVWKPDHPFVWFIHGDGDMYGVALTLILMCVISVIGLECAVRKAEDKCKVVVAGHERYLTSWKIDEGYRLVKQTYRNVMYYATIGLCVYLYWCSWLVLPLLAAYVLAFSGAPLSQKAAAVAIGCVSIFIVEVAYRALSRRLTTSSNRS